jgi:Na+/pantothenate symporter
MSIFIEIIGYIGTILCISAYFLNVRGRLDASSPYYLAANVVGGIFLVINSVYHWALPSAIENSIWALVALVGLMKVGKLK